MLYLMLLVFVCVGFNERRLYLNRFHRNHCWQHWLSVYSFKFDYCSVISSSRNFVYVVNFHFFFVVIEFYYNLKDIPYSEKMKWLCHELKYLKYVFFQKKYLRLSLSKSTLATPNVLENSSSFDSRHIYLNIAYSLKQQRKASRLEILFNYKWNY